MAVLICSTLIRKILMSNNWTESYWINHDHHSHVIDWECYVHDQYEKQFEEDKLKTPGLQLTMFETRKKKNYVPKKRSL